MTDTLKYSNPQGILDSSKIEPGMVRWKSPSNIALVKYWGKYGTQLPRNPSISLTLDAAYTETSIKYKAREKMGQGLDVRFYFEDAENEAFGARVGNYLDAVLEIFPFLNQLSLEIRSHNSFPHSSGIASSASSMSALALCLCTLEERLLDVELGQKEFDRKASYVARLGSGSAARSIFPGAALWGKMNEVEESSDEYAIPLQERLHKDFAGFRDWIFIVSRQEKSVSSTKGHEMMNNHDFAEARYTQARKKAHFLLDFLRQGKVDEAGTLIEEEALTLHGLMMCSQPAYLLLEADSLRLIQAIQDYRKRTGVPVFFTLDAGPNVHVLFPESAQADVDTFLREKFPVYFEKGDVIQDRIGSGPIQLD